MGLPNFSIKEKDVPSVLENRWKLIEIKRRVNKKKTQIK